MRAAGLGVGLGQLHERLGATEPHQFHRFRGRLLAEGRVDEANLPTAVRRHLAHSGPYGGLLAHPFLWSLAAATLSYFGALVLSPQVPGRSAGLPS